MNHPDDELKITEALESYPMEDLPDSFVENVMTRIQTIPQDTRFDMKASAVSRFLPAALGVFGVVFGAAVVVTYRLILAQINPLMIAYYRSLIRYWQLRLLLVDIPKGDGILALLAGVAIFYGLVYLFTDPRRQSQH